MRRLISIAAASVFIGTATTAAGADCIDAASAYHGTNPTILRAIAIYESGGKANAMHVNADGSIDRGMFQINSIHLKELAQYGITVAHLNDPCAASYIAAWHLRRQMEVFGNTWDAVGAYHSRSPGERHWYADKIRAIVYAIELQTTLR